MRDRLRLLGLSLAVMLAGGRVLAADQNAVSANAQVGAVAVLSPSNTERLVMPQDIETLPAVKVTVAVEPGHGPSQRTYEGPLLWTLLAHAGVVDTVKFRDQVHQAVIVTGSDGYSVVLALGEISPEFEAKQVIVAVRQDGEPLKPGHFRLVVPGEKRAGRSARDLARISIIAPTIN